MAELNDEYAGIHETIREIRQLNSKLETIESMLFNVVPDGESSLPKDNEPEIQLVTIRYYRRSEADASYKTDNVGSFYNKGELDSATYQSLVREFLSQYAECVKRKRAEKEQQLNSLMSDMLAKKGV